nr:universal stress protein [Actinomycetota bacterium]
MVRVVVPVAVLENEAVPLGLMQLLGTVDVTVLGYHVLPEQTPPDQARQQYEERANAALADVAEEFRAAGGDADYRLVFTADRQKSVNRVADEVDARAFVISGATGEVDRLLVSLSGDVAADRILSFTESLVGDRD